MNLRKIIFPLILSLLLLGTQQMGWAHALSHFADGSTSTSQGKQGTAEKICEQCLAFAQLGAGLQGPTSRLPAIPLEVFIAPVHAERSIHARVQSGFRSRAPPLPL